MAVECQLMADEALVEYAQGARREEWCADGHRGLVLEGAIEYEFNDGSPPLSAAKGEAFRLPGGSGHRGRNVAAAPTRLFLIDDPASGLSRRGLSRRSLPDLIDESRRS